MFSYYFIKHLKEGEEVVKIVRRYFMSYFFSILLSLVFILVPFFFLFPLFQRGGWGVAAFFLLLGIGLFVTIRNAIIWYFNGLVITNQRIIDFDQKGLFDKEVSESTYEKIQDVSFRKKGIFATLFNYGTIFLQTAGAQANLEIKNVFEPERVQGLITAIQRETAEAQAQDNKELSAQELIHLLEHVRKNVGEERFQRFLRQGPSSRAKRQGK